MRIVGIDVAADEIRVAEGERRLGRTRFVGLRRVSLAGAAPEACLAALRARRARVLTALPAAAVAHRRLILPFRDRRRLARTVPLELAGRLAAEVPDAVVAFARIGADADGTAVLAAAARARDLDACVAPLAAAGLPPAGVGLAPLPAWHLVAPRIGDAALVLADGPRSAVSVRRDGRLAGLRALGATPDAPDAFVAEVRWTLAALGEPPPALVLAGADAGPALAAALAAATGGRVVPIAEAGVATGADLAAAVVAAGLVVGDGDDADLRFAAGETAAPWRTAAALAAAAVVLAAVNVGLWRARLGARDVALRDAIRATAAAALPGAPLVAPRAELEAALASLGPGGSDGGARALTLLREASARIPASVRLDLERLVVEPGLLRLEGRAADFDAVETVRRALAGSPLLADVAAEEARATVDGRGVAFRLRAARRAGGGTSS